uniref:dnaJ homolog subfamily C member 14 n=1 Tax=Myxine glutinosa TaxID=7769 RepID=UPI00358E37CA
MDYTTSCSNGGSDGVNFGMRGSTSSAWDFHQDEASDAIENDCPNQNGLDGLSSHSCFPKASKSEKSFCSPCKNNFSSNVAAETSGLDTSVNDGLEGFDLQSNMAEKGHKHTDEARNCNNVRPREKTSRNLTRRSHGRTHKRVQVHLFSVEWQHNMHDLAKQGFQSVNRLLQIGAEMLLLLAAVIGELTLELADRLTTVVIHWWLDRCNQAKQKASLFVDKWRRACDEVWLRAVLFCNTGYRVMLDAPGYLESIGLMPQLYACWKWTVELTRWLYSLSGVQRPQLPVYGTVPGDSHTRPEQPKRVHPEDKLEVATVVKQLLVQSGFPPDQLDPYAAMGLKLNTSNAEIKKMYRQLAILVHPDKCRHPRAEEAFKVLRAAWDILSDPMRKREYDSKQETEDKLRKAMNDFMMKLQKDIDEAVNTMSCVKCGGKHKRYKVERTVWAGRYCARCDTLHGAMEGDLWAESSMLGFKITFYALMDGQIYDVTEWAACQHIPIPMDSHTVRYHLSTCSRPPSRTPSANADSESQQELQEILRRLFQDSRGMERDAFNYGDGFFGFQQPSPFGQPADWPRPHSESSSMNGETGWRRRKRGKKTPKRNRL